MTPSSPFPFLPFAFLLFLSILDTIVHIACIVGARPNFIKMGIRPANPSPV